MSLVVNEQVRSELCVGGSLLHKNCPNCPVSGENFLHFLSKRQLGVNRKGNEQSRAVLPRQVVTGQVPYNFRPLVVVRVLNFNFLTVYLHAVGGVASPTSATYQLKSDKGVARFAGLVRQYFYLLDLSINEEMRVEPVLGYVFGEVANPKLSYFYITFLCCLPSNGWNTILLWVLSLAFSLSNLYLL